MGLDVDADLRAKLLDLRQREGITATGLINKLLREYFNARESTS